MTQEDIRRIAERIANDLLAIDRGYLCERALIMLEEEEYVKVMKKAPKRIAAILTQELSNE